MQVLCINWKIEYFVMRYLWEYVFDPKVAKIKQNFFFF